MRECQLSGGSMRAWRSAALRISALVLISTSLLHAQDVAEAARQEQARKASQKSAAKHVYTDDDLKKAKILAPVDAAKAAARKRQQEETSAQGEAPKQPAGQSAQTESLGEIARRYRHEKAARQAEQAAKKSYTPFPYEVPQPAAATPKGGVGPITGVVPDAEPEEFWDAIRPNVPQKKYQPSATAHGRMSPFQPRLHSTPGAAITLSPAIPSPPALAIAPQAASVVDHPAVEPRSTAGLQTITAQPGDSWWKLATLYLGSGSRWKELRSLNPDSPNSSEILRSGARVWVPEGNAIHAKTPRPSQVRVKAGDSLWTLAREQLGRGSSWTCLASANPQIQDYRMLSIGTMVEIPQAGTCEVASAGPRE